MQNSAQRPAGPSQASLQTLMCYHTRSKSISYSSETCWFEGETNCRQVPHDRSQNAVILEHKNAWCSNYRAAASNGYLPNQVDLVIENLGVLICIKPEFGVSITLLAKFGNPFSSPYFEDDLGFWQSLNEKALM